MRKHANKLGLYGLLLAVALVLAACGGEQGGSNEDTQGTDRSGTVEATSGGTTEMGVGLRGMTEDMLAENGEYSDRRFIDAMVPHHEGAVEMAEVALENAEHEEVRRLAEDIISAQRTEIELLRSIREREFGSAEPAMRMSEEEMDGMGMADPRELANAEPFDRAFIDAMIPHHESAIAMAEVAPRESENREILALAQDILEAQRKEIEQMNTWRERWYPEG